MAEYYPLLAKAVAGLSNATPEMRRAVYERARNALLTQLKSLDPPIADADLAKESDALDGAVARLEAELANASNGQQPAQAVAAAAAAAPVTKPLRPNPLQAAQRPRPAMPAQRPPLRPSPTPSAAAPSPTASAPPPAPPPAALNDVEDLTAAAAPPLQVRKPEPLGKKAKAPPPLEVREAELPLPPDSDADNLLDEGNHVRPARAEGARIYAPQAAQNDEHRGSSFRLWIVGAIVGVVVATVAIAAWALRDRPDDLAKLKSHPVVQADQGGKIEERVGGPQPDAKPDATADSGSAAAPASAPAAPAPAASAAAPQSTAATDAAPKPADASQTAPIAYRAALLVEAPEEQNKYKTYEGTVIWRVDNVSGGNGQPPMMAVHADVDVPGDKLKVALTLQKNNDPSLPASHTITIDFLVKSDTPTGGIKQIGVPQLRADNVPSGEALVGVPVPTVENSFLVGLSRGTAEATNLDLLRQRAWVDIPIMLSNNKIAKLTFEKGTSGSRAIDDAINSWKSP